MTAGDKLTAIDPCVMCTGESALTVGKEYTVTKTDDAFFYIVDDNNEEHFFHHRIWDVFFTSEDPFQEFFSFMNQEHDLLLTVEEMQEILHEAQKLFNKLNSEL